MSDNLDTLHAEEDRLRIFSVTDMVLSLGGHEMDSSFFEKWDNQSKLKPGRNEKKERREENTKAWAYIGRFLWGFAIIEQAVDRIFADLFNKSPIAYLLCMGNVDFRKKLQFVEVGLKHQESRSRNSAQGDKWSFCLTAGTLVPANQERR